MQIKIQKTSTPVTLVAAFSLPLDATVLKNQWSASTNKQHTNSGMVGNPWPPRRLLQQTLPFLPTLFLCAARDQKRQFEGNLMSYKALSDSRNHRIYILEILLLYC